MSGFEVMPVGAAARLTQLEAEVERLRAQQAELLEALKLAVRQNEHDMLMTGDELRSCRAAIAKAEGQR